MNKAIFISDLHLKPEHPELMERFISFCQWALEHTKSLYILGDFFHLWIGDDDKASWITPIKEALFNLEKKGIKVYCMGGNRDFLLGRRFCHQTQAQYLSDATLIRWNGITMALTHGDCLCTKDKTHQMFYRFTRNAFFRFIFNSLPFFVRRILAQRVRQRSQDNKYKQLVLGHVTFKGIQKFTSRYPCDVVVHGHTHQPGLHYHVLGKKIVRRFVLSDWDDKVTVLCYNESKEFYFYHFDQKNISGV